MKFHVGDTVMHWNHGLGQITGLEERRITGESQLYYILKIRDLSIWVPADRLAAGRMRLPTSARAFKRLVAVLSSPAETLPDDRRERKAELHSRMTAGTAASICHVIRDLTHREKARPLNEDDRSTLDRARQMLLGEWQYALKVSGPQAEDDLHKVLKRTTTRTSDAKGRRPT